MSNRKITCGEKDTVCVDSLKDQEIISLTEREEGSLLPLETCGLGV